MDTQDIRHALARRRDHQKIRMISIYGVAVVDAMDSVKEWYADVCLTDMQDLLAEWAIEDEFESTAWV